MTQTVDTYSRQGFIMTAAFAAVTTVVGALVVYLSATERIDCRRSDARVDCVFSRTILGSIPVLRKRVPNVTSAHMATSDHDSDDAPTVTVYRLRVFGDNGQYLSVQTEEREVVLVQERLTAMLRDPATDRLALALTGSPRHHTWSAIVLAFGVTLVPLWILGYFFPSLRPNQRTE
jgi:hypothetical protein